MARRLELGLEIAPHEVRIARAERALGGLRVLGVERRAVADDVGVALGALARERPAAVHLAFAAQGATHRLLELPFGDRARLTEVAPLELLGRLPSTPDDTIVASTRVALAGGRGTVLAAAVRRTALESARALLARHGLPAGRTELAPLPAWALVPPHPADATLIVADGPRSALTCRRDGRLAALRALDTDAADPSALAGEIAWTLRALDAPAPLILTGADALGLAPALAQATGQEVLLLSDLASGGPAMAADDDLAAGAVALGLVTAGAGDLRLVLTGVAPIDRVAARRLRRLVAAAIVLGIVDLGLVHADLARREAALERAADAVAIAALPEVPAGEARARLEAAAALRRRAGAPSQGVLEVLRDLSSRVPAALPLDLDELGIDGESVRVHGRCRAFDAVDALRRALAASPFAREVVAEETRSTVDGEGVEFRLRIERRPATGAPS